MMYYILYPGNEEHDTVNDINQLGESSFGTFWAYKGFELLKKAIDQNISNTLIQLIKKGEVATVDLGV